MPLSPHEQRALAALEEGLHADDPAFAAVLAATPSIHRPFLPPPMALPRIFSLLAALGALIAAGALIGDRPVILAVVTVALLVPWLVWAARLSTYRPRAGLRPEQGHGGGVGK